MSLLKLLLSLSPQQSNPHFFLSSHLSLAHGGGYFLAWAPAWVKWRCGLWRGRAWQGGSRRGFWWGGSQTHGRGEWVLILVVDVDRAWLMGLMEIGLGWRFVNGLFMGLARFRVWWVMGCSWVQRWRSVRSCVVVGVNCGEIVHGGSDGVHAVVEIYGLLWVVVD